MNFNLETIFDEWMRQVLTDGIVNNISGMFDTVNSKVSEISGQVGASPQEWNRSIYTMIRSLSESVIVPIAGIILAFVMTIEFIQLIIDRNNFHDIDITMFFKWMFKTACAVLIVTNTWNIVMAVFDVSQSIVNSAAGTISSDTGIDMAAFLPDLEERLAAMPVGELLGLWLQSFTVGISVQVLTICIFLVSFGRMIEIYIVTSAAPIPMATMMSREGGQMGQNYLRSLAALGLQAFMILVCVGIYAALVRNITVSDDISYSLWSCMGYTVLLVFSLFKTGSMAQSVFNVR